MRIFYCEFSFVLEGLKSFSFMFLPLILPICLFDREFPFVSFIYLLCFYPFLGLL